MEKEIPPLNGRSFKELVVTNPGVKAYREPVCRNEEAEKYEIWNGHWQCDNYSLLPSAQFLAYVICSSYFVVWANKWQFTKSIRIFYLLCIPLGSLHLNRFKIKKTKTKFSLRFHILISILENLLFILNSWI